MMALDWEMDFIRGSAAFLSGCLLSLSGSLIQAVTQNELAGPSTLGFNAVVVLFVLIAHGITLLFPDLPSIEYLSFLLFFLLLSFCFSYFSFWRRRQKQERTRTQRFYGNKVAQNISTFILLGLCFNLFVGAVFSLLQFIFLTFNWQFPSQLWYGNFRFVQKEQILFLWPFALIIYGWALRLLPHLWPMSFGINFSAGFGIDIKKIQRHAVFLAFYAIGIVICFFGVFAFVGLLFPHLLRLLPWFRSHIEKEIRWGSLLSGGVFLILDWGCSSFSFYGAEIPVGMISSLLGTFVFMYVLVVRKLREEKRKE